MNYKIDLHTHTIASGHAYSTLLENVKGAKDNKIEVLGITDHGPYMPGGPHLFHFGNRGAVPSIIDDVIVLFGCEANIINYKGDLDMPELFLKRIDLVIASLHEVVIEPGTIEENTAAVIGAIKNPSVDILGHLGNPNYRLDYDEIVKNAKIYNKIIEINNGSFKSREGSFDNCINIAKLCNEYKVPVTLSSDSHISFTIGIFEKAEEVLKVSKIDEDLIINNDKNKILSYLKNKGRIKGIIL